MDTVSYVGADLAEGSCAVSNAYYYCTTVVLLSYATTMKLQKPTQDIRKAITTTVVSPGQAYQDKQR